MALVAHPDDERYQALFGTTVRTPLFGVEVPVLAHHLAEPDKGSGIAMVCTFGDLTDVIWWRELQPADPLGRRARRAAASRTPRRGWPTSRPRRRTPSSPGKTTFSARAAVVELPCGPAATSTASRRPTQRMVKFYENGDKPLEIVTTRQWYIRNGGRDEDLRRTFLERGARARVGTRRT